ncbi:MAG: toll/interleukin-1 receptor domain-containing protein [Thermoanaerobaculia bacterium]|nr:toll/interleukin-1 receptor domain-containing protein [Thermoanaerobaculia bacterium]
MPGFKYACFISYRNSKAETGENTVFAEQLYDAIRDRVDNVLYNDLEDPANHLVFLDKKVMGHGEFINTILGQAICKSICWVVIFTRGYLRGSLWCASELESMLKLEQTRFNTLQIANPVKSFIIPILFRGDKADLPEALQNITFETKLAKFSLAYNRSTPLTNDAELEPEIAKLIDEIVHREKIILDQSPLEAGLCKDCDTFALVNVTEQAGYKKIQEFVQELKKKDPPPMAHS